MRTLYKMSEKSGDVRGIVPEGIIFPDIKDRKK